MLNLREYKNVPDRLTDLLPWAALVASGVILNKDGSFQATVSYRGPDLDSATEEELMVTSARVNNVFKRLGSGWAVYAEAQREKSSDYPDCNFPDRVSYLIDNERRQMFASEPHFESNYYLTLIYLPPRDTVNKIAATFIDSDKDKNYAQVLESFIQDVSRLTGLLASVFRDVAWLNDEETLSFLHRTISDRKIKMSLPASGMFIDSIISDSSLITGFEPKLGQNYLKVITVKAFPTNSYPGILDRLNRLGISYRWVTRFICLDKAEAEKEINKYKKRWFAKRKGVLTLLKETIFNSESVMGDSDAVNKAEDADCAQQELLSDAVNYGYFTASIVLADKDREIVRAQVCEVERAINSLGFVCHDEDINAVDAYLGTIPGNTRNNVRRPIVNTLNLAHLMPISALWAGDEFNHHFATPALIYSKTGGSTQFRLNLHVGDVGHTLVLGPTGSGKSVLLNLIAAQFLRYKNAQVYIFDKGASSKILTAGIGGRYFDLGANELSFSPLSNIDEVSEKSWAQEWLISILEQENVEVTPNIKEQLWIALNSLATAPKEQRTIFGLSVLLQNESLKQALLPFTISGAHGRLLDASKDTLRLDSWQSFEMERLMETPSVVLPVLSYLFHRLEERFTGRPTLLVIDEAWIFLDNPTFSKKIREWLKVLRKQNVSVVFATQSLSDVQESKISNAIKESCLTKIYLPNSSALNEDSMAFYEKFGLNQTQIRILAEATPKKDYYYSSPNGNRLFELGLGEVALAYCGATSKQEQLGLNHRVHERQEGCRWGC
jgi:type IV secretion/conjugal transfer VirB4 family ATPase